jgi:ATP-dependent RNA helicase RhlE
VTFKEFNLDPPLLAAVARAGYTTPTAIQEAAIPPALDGQDLIGTAQTGTGKTAAFVLPILHKLLGAQGPHACAHPLAHP